MKKFVVLLVLLLLAGGGVWWFVLRPGKDAAASVKYRTAKVDRGEVIEGVAASGTVQPVELIQVGTQISGTIQKLFADFNSKVTANQPIALLDARRLESQVAQDEASLARATADVTRVEASVAQSKADVVRSKAALTQAKTDVDRVQALLAQARADLERQKQLVEKRLTSPSDVDAAVATEGSLRAQLASAEASIAQNEAAATGADAAVLQSEAQVAVSEATVKQIRAQLEGDRVNLGYATILSPVDGVVVSRNVDVGQTVAASLSAPTLFVIAKDLTKVHVEVSVPEADIGRVKVTQPASFTVDAYPEKTFPGEVAQVRMSSTTVQNVVTYIVIVAASNPDGLLFPGMTANVTFEVARSPKDSLRVPATALRLKPAADLVDAAPPSPKSESSTGDPSKADQPKPDGTKPEEGTRPGSGRGGGAREGRTRRPRGVVYVVAPGNRLRAVAVRTSISDGAYTVVDPVEAGSLVEGADVVTAIVREDEAATTNPFAPPRMPGGGGRGGR